MFISIRNKYLVPSSYYKKKKKEKIITVRCVKFTQLDIHTLMGSGKKLYIDRRVKLARHIAMN